ncbi:MAG: fimbrillin family protein [Bacteroides sp.]
MRRIAFIGLLLCAAACSREAIPEAWEVAVSRAVTGGEKMLVVGQKNGVEQLRGILIPSAEENTPARWEEPKPTWPGTDERLDLYVISPVPDGEQLPHSISAAAGKTWMVDYLPSTYKPASFSLTHLMAKLQVHIRVDNHPEQPEPLNATIALHTTADIDYPHKALTNLSGRSSGNVSLGTFTQDPSDNWVSAELLVLPQTLPQGELCLRFEVSGGDAYTFTPDTDLPLLAGKVNHLYLGVAYEQSKVIQIGSGTSVSDWNDGGSQSEEAAEA